MEFDNFYIASLKQSSNVWTAVMENGIASVAYNTNGKRYDLKRWTDVNSELDPPDL